METKKQKIPEGYTALYKQTTLVTDEPVSSFVMGMNFSLYMQSKGAAPIYSGTSDRGNKEEVYFHPEFAVRREYKDSLSAHQGLVITQPEGTENTILEDILNDFPEFRMIGRSTKKGVKDPSTVKPCF